MDSELEFFVAEADFAGERLRRIYTNGLWMTWQTPFDFGRDSLGVLTKIIEFLANGKVTEFEDDMLRLISQYCGETIRQHVSATWERSVEGSIVLRIRPDEQGAGLVDLQKLCREEVRRRRGGGIHPTNSCTASLMGQ